MMTSDALLAWCTRRLCRVRGFARLVTPIRRLVSNHYADAVERRTTIGDYRGKYKFKLDRTAYMGSCIYWFGWHHKEELLFLEKNVRPQHVLVDIGANTGEFVVALAPRARQILCFEPQADVLEVLKDNVAINGFTNVIVFPFGLSDRDEIATLYSSSDRVKFGGLNEGLHTRYQSGERDTASGASRFRPLDAVLVESGIKHIDWLKIDVEGAELSVLRGARETLTRSRPRILIELNDDMCRLAGYTAHDIHQFLGDLGYQGYYLSRTNKLIELDERKLDGSLLNAVYLFS